jgi:hypothetical protein
MSASSKQTKRLENNAIKKQGGACQDCEENKGFIINLHKNFPECGEQAKVRSRCPGSVDPVRTAKVSSYKDCKTYKRLQQRVRWLAL